MDAQLIIYSVFYLIMAVCLIYPPIEFLEFGFTINNIFSYWLGSEYENFIFYHIKRISLTLMLYSFIPLGYIFFLTIYNNNQDTYFFWSENNFTLWSVFATITVILPIASLYQILNWWYDNWKYHPVVINLLKFCPNWKPIASDINAEYRSINKISIQSNAITKLIATENWIIKVSALSFDICHHSDTSLLVIDSDVHEISLQGNRRNQFITINVKTTRPHVANFKVRLNSTDFKDLEDRWGRAIPILSDVKFHKNITEKFIDAFKLVVQENARFATEQELDLCIGCMQTRANVTLQRNCTVTAPNDAGIVDNVLPQFPGDSEPCANCYCRPLWCCDCLARWFATRQSAKDPNVWMAAKCSCPMCRVRFCVLDVCLIEGERDKEDGTVCAEEERDGEGLDAGNRDDLDDGANENGQNEQ